MHREHNSVDRPPSGRSTVANTGRSQRFGGEGLQRWRNDAGLRYRLQESGVDIAAISAVAILASVLYGLIRPNAFAFTSTANISVAFQTIPFLGIVALGVGLLMVAGEFDLSVGVNYIFSSILMAQLFTSDGVNVWLAAVIGLACGTAIGALNGWITLWLKIPSFIATLGTMGIWEAGMLVVHGAAEQSFAPPKAFADLTAGSIGIIPAELLWYGAFAGVAWLLLHRHRVGNHLLAVGGNRAAAAASGVNVRRTKLIAFTIAGFAAALAGILSASSIGDIATTSGQELPLQAIAACVIGGASLTGGSGNVLGMVLGAVLIYWIQDVLLLLGAPGYYLTAFVGALIIGSVVAYQRLHAVRG